MDKITTHAARPENSDPRRRVATGSDPKTYKPECSHPYKPQPLPLPPPRPAPRENHTTRTTLKRLPESPHPLLRDEEGTKRGWQPAPAPGQGGFLHSHGPDSSPSPQSIPEPLPGDRRRDAPERRQTTALPGVALGCVGHNLSSTSMAQKQVLQQKVPI